MSVKQIVIVFVAVLVGSFASAAAIRYVEPVGRVVLTAPTGIPLLDEHAAFKSGAVPAEKRGEHALQDHKDDDHKGHGDHRDDDYKGHEDPKSQGAHQRDDHKGHDDHKDDDHKGHGGHKSSEHKDHYEHSGHDDHDEERVVKLGKAEQRESGIEVGTAGSGALRLYVTLPGEVALNADQRAHVVPRVSGVVQAVYKTLGDHVRVGDGLAVLDSRELADLKSAYLTATEQAALAQSTFDRETDLRRKKITSSSRPCWRIMPCCCGRRTPRSPVMPGLRP